MIGRASSEFSLILEKKSATWLMSHYKRSKFKFQMQEPLTMDGDHMGFFVDETTGESSLSMEILNVAAGKKTFTDCRGNRS